MSKVDYQNKVLP